MYRLLLSTLLLLSSSLTAAATLVEVKSSEGQTRIYTDGQRARMETGKDGYMIVDNKAQSLFVVMPNEQRVMDMSQALQGPGPGASAAPIDIRFDKQGSGPRIAGYPTTRYNYSANGQSCGTLLASRQALEDTGLDSAFEMMERMASRADAMRMAFNSNTPPCERAGTQFSTHVRKIGVPMRITAGNGQLVSEITRIDQNAKLPPNAFTVPAGYQVQDTGQMMRDAQQMMQQMQQSGQLPPGAMEQLRRMQQR